MLMMGAGRPPRSPVKVWRLALELPEDVAVAGGPVTMAEEEAAEGVMLVITGEAVQSAVTV